MSSDPAQAARVGPTGGESDQVGKGSLADVMYREAAKYGIDMFPALVPSAEGECWMPETARAKALE